MSRAQAGFTMIEVLVAMTITLIGLAGLLAIHTTSIGANRSAAHTAEATALGEQTLEQLRSMSVDRILSGLGEGAWPIDTPLVDVELGAVTYRRRLIAVEVPADPDLVRIQVDVDWTERGAAPGAEGGKHDHQISLEVVRTKADAL